MNKNQSIFISSTFKDMQQERDIIKEQIYPEVLEYSREYGFSFEIVDLRWGISTKGSEEEANVKILRTCFEEIKRSKPFFLVFLGSRYGWIPEEKDILDAVNRNQQYYIKDASVTELEINYAIQYYKENTNCLFYFRTLINEEEIPDIYFTKNSQEQKKIKLLKEKLLQQFPNQCFEYFARYDHQSNKIVQLEEVKEKILYDIKTRIFKTIKDHKKPLHWIEEYHNHLTVFFEQKNCIFAAREEELKQMDKVVESSAKIIGLIGNSGIGKSSLISHFIQRLSLNQNNIVIPFSAGISRSSSTYYDFLLATIYRMISHLKLRQNLSWLISKDISYYEEAKVLFYNLLETLAKEKHVIIILDAINQFSRQEFKEYLEWLNPYAIPKNVTFLLSMTDDCAEIRELEKKEFLRIELKGFRQIEIKEVITSILKLNKKELYPELLELVQNKVNKRGEYLCSNPLYLTILLNQLIHLDATDFQEIDLLKYQKKLKDEQAIYLYLENIISQAPPTIDHLLRILIEKASLKINKSFVDQIFSLLALSRSGFREMDFESIFKILDKDYSSADFYYFKRLFNMILTQRDFGQYYFNHAKIEKIVRNLYPTDNSVSLVFCKAISDCMDLLPYSDPLKNKEYFYFLYLTNQYKKGYYYLEETKNIYPLYEVIQLEKNEKTSFFASLIQIENNHFLTKVILSSLDSSIPFEIKEIALLKLLYYSSNRNEKEIFLKLYQNLGNNALSFGKIPYALKTFKIALKIAKKYHIQSAYCELYLKLSEVEKMLNNEWLAKFYFHQAKKINLELAWSSNKNQNIITRQNEDPIEMVHYHLQMAQQFFEQSNSKESLNHSLDSMKLILDLLKESASDDQMRLLSHCHFALGKAYSMEKMNCDKAHHHYQEAIKIIEKIILISHQEKDMEELSTFQFYDSLVIEQNGKHSMASKMDKTTSRANKLIILALIIFVFALYVLYPTYLFMFKNQIVISSAAPYGDAVVLDHLYNMGLILTAYLISIFGFSFFYSVSIIRNNTKSFQRWKRFRILFFILSILFFLPHLGIYLYANQLKYSSFSYSYHILSCVGDYFLNCVITLIVTGLVFKILFFQKKRLYKLYPLYYQKVLFCPFHMKNKWKEIFYWLSLFAGTLLFYFLFQFKAVGSFTYYLNEVFLLLLSILFLCIISCYFQYHHYKKGMNHNE